MQSVTKKYPTAAAYPATSWPSVSQVISSVPSSDVFKVCRSPHCGCPLQTTFAWNHYLPTQCVPWTYSTDSFGHTQLRWRIVAAIGNSIQMFLFFPGCRGYLFFSTQFWRNLETLTKEPAWNCPCQSPRTNWRSLDGTFFIFVQFWLGRKDGYRNFWVVFI